MCIRDSGRTGHWFALERWGVQPDIVSFAKAVTSGYIPMGGFIVSKEIMDALQNVPADAKFMHAYTNSAHPTASAVGLRNLQIIEDEQLVNNAQAMGQYLTDGLHNIFDGKQNIYNDWDTPNPLSVYGKSKFYSEKDVIKAKKAIKLMEQSKWYDALKEAWKARDKSIYNFIQWKHLLTTGNKATFTEYNNFIKKNSNYPRISRIKYGSNIRIAEPSVVVLAFHLASYDTNTSKIG